MKKKQENRRRCIFISDEMWRSVQDAAARDMRSTASLVRAALKSYLLAIPR